jgi:ATP-dependent helicase/nuclease subunit B
MRPAIESGLPGVRELEIPGVVALPRAAAMSVQFLLGPAGSGKTWRVLEEIRAELRARPEGDPLLLLAPKQATFLLERQLLADDGPAGFARLHILSFERLALWWRERLSEPDREVLGEEGRVMVLRALLRRHKDVLGPWSRSAARPGFARRLSGLLRRFQHQQLSAGRIETEIGTAPAGLETKLQLFVQLLADYRAWLQERNLLDADELILDTANQLQGTRSAGPSYEAATAKEVRLGGVWLDGFAELTPAELELLAATVGRADRAMLAFCLDHEPDGETDILSPWSVIGQTFYRAHARLAADSAARVEVLRRSEARSRFSTAPALAELERAWLSPMRQNPITDIARSIEVLACPDPEAEAETAARRIREFVRAGGRYRDVAVLPRRLDESAPVFARVFRRYDIPLFLDRREPAAHHPAGDLFRAALRLVAWQWRTEDWMTLLKTGLAGVDESDADRLENASLAAGWTGQQWRSQPPPGALSENAWRRLVEPFHAFERLLSGVPITGSLLAQAGRELFAVLNVSERLASWQEAQPGAAHELVGRAVSEWFDAVETGFASDALSAQEWLPVVDSALGTLTVGVVPPTLDQVLMGAIDRSRNPDLRLVILPGWNEGVFPAPAPGPDLLTGAEADWLDEHRWLPSPANLRQLGHERFFAYIALTRSSERVLVTHALAGPEGDRLSPSPFLHALRRLVPDSAAEAREEHLEHPCERTLPPWLPTTPGAAFERERAAALALHTAPSVAEPAWTLDRHLVRRLVPSPPRFAVTAIETFRKCPYQHFAARLLAADEREVAELDSRKSGSLAHRTLERFHRAVAQQPGGWRELPESKVADLMETAWSEAEADLKMEWLTRSPAGRADTARWIRRLVGFVTRQLRARTGHAFEPERFEQRFGDLGGEGLKLRWVDGTTVEVAGKIDRLDRAMAKDGHEWWLVIDYKSSKRRFDESGFKSGTDIQLVAYLAALAAVPDIGLGRIAGALFAQITGESVRSSDHRDDAPKESATLPFRGRLNFAAHPSLALKADERVFATQLKKDGQPHAGSDLIPPEALAGLCEEVKAVLMRTVEKIMAGRCEPEPAQLKGRFACEACDWRTVCRSARD